MMLSVEGTQRSGLWDICVPHPEAGSSGDGICRHCGVVSCSFCVDVVLPSSLTRQFLGLGLRCQHFKLELRVLQALN